MSISQVMEISLEKSSQIKIILKLNFRSWDQHDKLNNYEQFKYCIT